MQRIYRARFFIEEREQEGPRLAPVAQACLRWAIGRDAFKEVGDQTYCLENPLEPIEWVETESGVRLESNSMVENGASAWAIRFSHLDHDDSNIRWTTEVALRSVEEQDLDVACTVFAGREGGVHSPIRRKPSRPRVVSELVQAFPCRVDSRISSKYRQLGSKNLSSFLDFIRDPSRKLPVVFISCSNRSNRALVNPKRVADWLSGIAHTWAAANSFVSSDLQSIHGLPYYLNARDGAVRIYWPGFSFADDPQQHRLFKPEYLARQEDSSRRIDLITEPVALAAIGQHQRNAPSWLGLQEKLRLRRFAEIRESASSERELIELYEREASSLQSKIAGLESDLLQIDNELVSTKEQLYQVELERDAYRQALESNEPATRDAEHEPNSLAEAVEIVERRHTDRLICALNSSSNWKKNPFKRPGEALQALGFLAEEWWESKMGNKRPDRDFDHLLKERLGWTFRSSQANSTMGRWANEYTASFDDRSFELAHHLVYGSAKNSRYSLRIAFAWDEVTEKVVIGYIGQHQTNTRT